MKELLPSWRRLNVLQMHAAPAHSATRVLAPGTHFGHLADMYNAYISNLSADPDKVYFCAFEMDGELAAVLPLESATEILLQQTLRVFRLPRHDHFPLADFAVLPQFIDRIDVLSAVNLLAKVTGRGWDLLRLEPVLEDSCVAMIIKQETMPRAMETRFSTSDAMATAAPYQDYLGTLSKNFRGALRKSRNKLEKLEGIRFESTRDPLELAIAFDKFLEIEGSGWKGSAGSGTAISLDPELKSFYGTLVQEFGFRGQLEINRLMHGDKTIAAQFGVLSGDRLHLLKIGYDETYKREAPGNMLLEMVMKKYQGDSSVRFVDLVSSAGWHESWKLQVREIYSYTIFNRTPRGLVSWASAEIRDRLRPSYRELRSRVRELGEKSRNRFPMLEKVPFSNRFLS